MRKPEFMKTVRRFASKAAAGLLVCSMVLTGSAAGVAVTAQAAEDIFPQGTLGTDIKKGDINNDGEISLEDVVAGLKTLTGTYSANTLAETAGDVNDDGTFSVRDILLLLEDYNGLLEEPLVLGIDNLEEVRYDADDVVPDVYQEGSDFLSGDTVAFYGADGYGKYTTGGRGGEVIYVTNLDDSGEGSLRDALENHTGARIIVFRVSGNINLKSELTISNGDVTIAGQTAPGDGITITNFPLNIDNCSNVIIRYMSFRVGDYAKATGNYDGGEYGYDALSINNAINVMIDHCDASWGTDETLSISVSSDDEYLSDNITVQWSIISESLSATGQNTNVGARLGLASLIHGGHGSKYSFHHNLYACHASRMPDIGSGADYEDVDGINFEFEFINNVVYGWGGSSAGKSPAGNNDSSVSLNTVSYDFISNYYLSGLEGGDYMLEAAHVGHSLYAYGNMMNGVEPEESEEQSWSEGQLSLVDFADDILDTTTNKFNTEEYGYIYLDLDTLTYQGTNEAFNFSYVRDERLADSEMETIQSAEDAYAEVMAEAGNSLSRDSIDTGLVEGVESGTIKKIDFIWESAGWSSGTSPTASTGTEYGEWLEANYPNLASYTPYVDSDGDGMSDAWEEAMGLDPEDDSDGAAQYLDTEYTNLDVFLQFLVENPAAAIAQ